MKVFAHLKVGPKGNELDIFLTNDGWRCPLFKPIEQYLQNEVPFGSMGPADGFPIPAMATYASELLDAEVVYVLSPPSEPPGTAY